MPWLPLVIAWLAVAAPVQAIPLDVPLNRLHRTVWTSKEGAPADAWAIAQTTDGWMWFGSPNGLYRFDGVAFERVETDGSGSAKSRAVSSLLSLESGDLVIGYHNGGVGILRSGRTVNFHESDGFDGATVFDLIQDADHRLWAATRTGLRRYDGRKWQRIGQASGLPDGATIELGRDVDGRIWVAMKHQLFYLERGKEVFEPGPVTAEPAYMIQSPDARLWCGSAERLEPCPFQHASHVDDASFWKKSSDVALFDHDGTLWTVSDTAILRTASAEALASLPRFGGMPAQAWRKRLGPEAVLPIVNSVKTLLLGRDGSIWMTTVRGTVEQIRAVEIAPGPSTVGHDGTGGLSSTRDGAVWLAVQSNFYDFTAGDGLWRLDGGRQSFRSGRRVSVSLSYRSGDDTLWAASGGWLWRRRTGRFVRDVRLPVDNAANPAVAMADDTERGSTWVSMLGAGLFLRDRDKWLRNGGVAGMPDNEPASLANDEDGTLWLGYGNGRVLSFSKGRVTRDLRASDAGVGSVRIISAGRFVLVGGDRGLAILRDGRFVAVTTDEPMPLEGLSGIVQLSSGEVWLNGLGGLSRISPGQLEEVLRTGVSVVAVRTFDASDGYPGDGATKIPFGSSLTSAANGKIWFSADTAVGSLDPARIDPGHKAAPLVLRSLTTAAGRIDSPGATQLSAGTRGIQIDYTALDFEHPDRERFRYRLAGLDEHWTSAGSRRQAFFTNLGPGHYRFEVESRNGIDTWQSTPVSLEIDIPPTFVQSRYFIVICVIAGLLALRIVGRTREQQLRGRERVKLNERLAERERIARELHDTLLQSTQGLALKVHAASTRIPVGEPARSMLDEALHEADLLMIEGRDRIQEIRARPHGSRSLEDALQRLGKRLEAAHGIAFHYTTQGAERPLVPLISDETYRIGAEALLNAFRHARATRIEIELIFERDFFRMRVRDDGVGIDPAILSNGQSPGHWGLSGMRERATKLGGVLEVWSAGSAGTEVEFRASAQVAYASLRPSWRTAWWAP